MASRKKKKQSAVLPRFSLLGVEMTPKVWIALFLVVGGIGAGFYFLVGLASATASADDARYVDAVSLFPVKPQDSVLRLGGSSRLVVIRDNPQGDFVLLRLKMSATFLADRDRARSGSVSLNAADFQLDGNQAKLLLPDSVPRNPTTLDLLSAKTKEQLQPGGADLGPQKLIDISKVDIRFEDKNGVEIVNAKGAAEYKTPAGMHIRFGYAGSRLGISWDGDSSGWLGQTHFLTAEQLIGNVEMYCLLPRPKGEIKSIDILGKPIKLKIRN